MKQLIWKILLATLLLLPLTSLHALLIEEDWSYYAGDNNLLTFDTDTVLYWLDLSVTYGMTVTEVESLIMDGPFTDFAYADYSTVMQFHANGGVGASGSGADVAVAADFAEMLGASPIVGRPRIVASGVTSTNWYDFMGRPRPANNDDLIINTLIVDIAEYFPESLWYYWHDPVYDTVYEPDSYSSPSVGHYLVSASVPEPSTLLLMGAGIVGIGVTRIRKRK
ncbi:MAG: PEP-CTERM sorting domain-containing protein [Candidatus Thiodiazotropha sp.]